MFLVDQCDWSKALESSNRYFLVDHQQRYPSVLSVSALGILLQDSSGGDFRESSEVSCMCVIEASQVADWPSSTFCSFFSFIDFVAKTGSSTNDIIVTLVCGAFRSKAAG
jgi:hypothetical protein